MHNTDDPDYLRTKNIKRGRDRLDPSFDALAAWISSACGSAVLNVIRDRVGPKNILRIDIVLESEADHKSVYADVDGFSAKREAISRKYHELLGVPEEEMLVAFSSFESVAKTEANERIPAVELNGLYEKYKGAGLWQVSRMYTSVTFFFYTDAQSDAARSGETGSGLKADYFRILKPHDEFDFYNFGSFEARFDSKENLDKNYQGNWYYYYK